MRLSKMFKDSPVVDVTGLSTDSRTIKEGNLYFALPGLSSDGHDYIDHALQNGASVIVHSRDIEKKSGAIYIKVHDVVEAMNQAASIYFGKPNTKLELYGITGTNGKTSIANIMRYLKGEKETGYIGTIGIFYGNTRLDPDLTTPDTLKLLKILQNMVNAKMSSVMMEVSSHGLNQGRVDALDFDVTIFSNFTYDHLDYHGTMDNYFSAKSKLFAQRTKPDGISVLNVDDGRFEDLKKITSSRIVTYGIDHPADYRASEIEILPDGTRFVLEIKGDRLPVKTNLHGRVNVYNLLAALAALNSRGVDLREMISRADSIPQIPGRFELIDEGQPFKVVVDFAHTPDGMEKIMEYGRSLLQENGKLIAVFGSAGKRDVAKRKVFGEIADKYCSQIILTKDDPRDEDARQIAEQIDEGIDKARSIFIRDRYEAIRQAIEQASAGDVVLILGKGDEPFMYEKDGREPWMGDNVAAADCIQRILDTEERD